MRKFLIVATVLVSLSSLCGCVDKEDDMTEKPVIYLYPESEQDINVSLELDGQFTYTYPEYDVGWHVKASPSGKLLNYSDNHEYNYLFWEANLNQKWSFETGFVVEGELIESFLIEKLIYLGLEPNEYNEFITYWVPRMEDNKYNLLYFADTEYEEVAKLIIVPTPDSILRVQMIWKSVDCMLEIEEQELKPFDRTGFTVIEWGGTEVVD